MRLSSCASRVFAFMPTKSAAVEGRRDRESPIVTSVEDGIDSAKWFCEHDSLAVALNDRTHRRVRRAERARCGLAAWLEEKSSGIEARPRTPR